MLRDLKQAGSAPGEAVDHLREAWARKMAPYEVEHGRISVSIEDLSGRFNLNSLVVNQQVNQTALQRFRRLLLRPQIEPLLAERLIDWLDDNQDVTGSMAPKTTSTCCWSRLYRAANRPMQDVSELRLLLELSERDYRRLLPHVSALPAATALNVNTASALVLSTLADTLSPQAAQQLVQARGAEGYRQLADFTNQPALAGAGRASHRAGAGQPVLCCAQRSAVGRAPARVNQCVAAWPGRPRARVTTRSRSARPCAGDRWKPLEEQP